MTESVPQFFLTRWAALGLRSIYTRSRREWGDEVADRYISDLYIAMQQAATNPEAGRLRQYRSTPFLMIPSQRHFIIYDIIPRGIVVLTIQHQVRDIETLVTRQTPAFLTEVERLKRGP